MLPSRETPKLQQYCEKHPECATNIGMACYCGSRSIRLWREQRFLSMRQHHICNHCGRTPYTTDAEAPPSGGQSWL
ncbi:hypothetical protein E5S69_08765 [Cupriavidus necator]|nr:hypothetical protein [Cupriavidus necator]